MKSLTVSNLVKSYGNRKIVDDISLEVFSGEVTGLLGPNGAGKTTIFYMIIGLTNPDKGTICLNEENIETLPMYKRAQKGIGYLPQEPSIFRKLTVEENFLAILEMYPFSDEERKDRLDELLNELRITHLAKNKAYTLSGGERRRVEISRSLISRPQFILLDEPFAGIDPKAIDDIHEIIHHLKNKGIGILITDHNVRETLHITDRAYIINEGKILEQGTPDEIAGSKKVRRIFLGDRFQLLS
ncbi:MAG: LPS export ABC transporter ATP-binding protein [Candidatus Schekmanbacteria bacterium RBG_16_38_11]|uniref:LPS export ABC transporter ATP-binding protein n=2 Tax=Candidatus Schekmaniibacteriota TaxID=1817811 RepID=A0A1F7RP90_9BACT|nr:MAG: LPS export ABC transporter ATP-binding protein [Candidatus Schekmanbacteria bacterium GWA2_38_11]OGL45756.1 MAG: LPS export ABC transporter ATP-binding protein [Candidatus Schekmanbacteria bacterium RBG_16_38_11]